MGGRWTLVQIQSPRPFSCPPLVLRPVRGGPDVSMIAWLLYQAADVTVRVLPGSLADRLTLLLARLAFTCGLPARRAQEDNLARLLTGAAPRTIRRRAREAFEH